MNLTQIKTAMFSVLLALFLLAVGCSKLTNPNYDKLKIGLDYDEVVNILGKADECSGAIGFKKCRWGDDKKYIKVKFAGNKVVLFSAQGR